MSDTATLERLFKYKAWANDAMLTALQQLDAAAPATEIALRALSHTYVVDQIFAAHMRRADHAYASANLAEAPTLAKLREDIAASDRWYVDYVSALGESERAEVIDFAFTDGEPGRMSREEMLMHVIVHGALHRGQIGWIMALNAVDPPADGLTSYLHTAEASTRRRQGAQVERVDAGAVVRLTSLAAGPPSPVAPPDAAPAASRVGELTRRMQVSVAAAPSLGKTLKFNLKGEGVIFIDGGSVTNDDRPAHLTLTATIDDLRAIGQGRLAPMAAIMTGRLGLSDMGVALGLQTGIKALFAHMPP
jgi:uncharacterized damage-inducible protein DinB/putative sterol carrier protein